MRRILKHQRQRCHDILHGSSVKNKGKEGNGSDGNANGYMQKVFQSCLFLILDSFDDQNSKVNEIKNNKLGNTQNAHAEEDTRRDQKRFPFPAVHDQQKRYLQKKDGHGVI